MSGLLWRNATDDTVAQDEEVAPSGPQAGDEADADDSDDDDDMDRAFMADYPGLDTVEVVLDPPPAGAAAAEGRPRQLRVGYYMGAYSDLVRPDRRPRPCRLELAHNILLSPRTTPATAALSRGCGRPAWRGSRRRTL